MLARPRYRPRSRAALRAGGTARPLSPGRGVARLAGGARDLLACGARLVHGAARLAAAVPGALATQAAALPASLTQLAAAASPRHRPLGGRRRARPSYPLLLGLLLAPAVWAVVMAVTYDTELNMNNGHDVPAGQRNLPGGTINITCDAPQANVILFNQLGDMGAGGPGEISQFGAACDGDGEATDTPDPATTTNLLFEGRTQVITQVTDNDNIPELGPTTFVNGTDAGEAIFFDADTGPPDHAILDTNAADAFQSTNPNTIRDLPSNTVIFNQAAAMAGPLDLVIQGRVLNIPAMGAPLGEVGATVIVDIVRMNGGSIAPETTPRTTFTGPFLIPYAVNPAAAADNPSFDGVANEEGAFVMGFDWTTVQDGTYLLTFAVNDVQGNSSPNDGNNLVVRVIIDRTIPDLVFTNPPSPFIANTVTIDDCEDVDYVLEGRVGESLTLPATVDLMIFHDEMGVNNPLPGSGMVEAETSPIPGVFAFPVNLTTAPVPTLPGEQDVYVTIAQATDAAMNQSGVATHVTIWDLVPTLTPTFLAPGTPFTTNGAQLTLQGRVDNIRPGAEDLEEHGTVDFEVTIFPTAMPTMRTTFVAGGFPSAALHDSQLDVIEADTGTPFPFVDADNFLGNIPDFFDFTLPINLAGFPDDNYTVELQTVDQACNRSALSTITVCIGRLGPRTVLDLGMSGPDDNYDTPELIPTRPPNQFGADDPVFIVSLRSPERPDPGNPAGPIPVPFPAPPFDFDPGSTDFLTLRGVAMDACTGVVEVRAEGDGIPTTAMAILPPMNTANFTLDRIDISVLPENFPTVIELIATNAFGQEGPTTSVVVIRDVIPGRAPVIEVPQPLPFFTNQPTLDVDGIAEPFARVALILPPTTGAVVPPIPRTTNGDAVNPPLIPNPRSLFNSIPSFAVVTQAGSDGRFFFRGVSLDTVPDSFATPTTLLLQAIDTFDNTDPVLSVTPLDIFRTTGAGNAVQVLIDPGTMRELEVFPAPPTLPPTSGQFRGLEVVDVEITFDTLVTVPPALTVTQNAGAPPRTAALVIPADRTNLQTTTLTYRYPVIGTVEDFDGPVLLDFMGGLDVFGNVPNPLGIANAFFVDSVPPVLVTTDPTSPAQAERVMDATPILQADLEDVPASVTTTASGVSTSASFIQLFGPLQTNPDTPVPVVRVTPTGTFDVAFTPAMPLTVDGAYRWVINAVDNVGNRQQFVRTFVFDTTAIPRASVINDPECDSAVNSLPQQMGTTAISATFLDPTIDLAASMIRLVNSEGGTVPTTTLRMAPNLLAAVPTPPLALDGSDDDQYTVLIDPVDSAGNASPQVTCPFVLDTVAPSVAFSFPATGACVNDPFRITQVALADPPAATTTSVFSSGLDLDRTEFGLRLLEPAFPSRIATGTLLGMRATYRTTSASRVEATALEVLAPGGGVRSLAADGSEDGVYQIEAFIADRAGNARTHTSTFVYDTQEPHVVLTEFPDPSSLAGASFTLRGEAFDLGPCGFSLPTTPFVTPTLDTVEVRVVARDPLGRPILPPAAPFFDFLPATSMTEITTGLATGISQRAAFTFTGTMPDAGGRDALLQVRVTDGAGNFRIIDRRIDIGRDPLPPPVLRQPENSAFVNDKVVRFRWDHVLVPDAYDLELTRVTPAPLTTSTTFVIPFPSDELEVDLPLFASSVPGGSPVTDTSAFTWRVRARDASGNPGTYSAPFSFTLDPVSPEVGTVAIGGQPIGPTVAFVGGANTLTLTYLDDSGMDPARPPEVQLRLRDPDHPDLRIPMNFTGNLEATGTLTLPVPGVDADPNGPAILVVRNAFDLAGNPMPEMQFEVLVDVGPFVDIRLAPNPVNPVELLLGLVTREFRGGPAEQVPFSAVAPFNPQVLARQQGRTEPELVSVNPVEMTTPASSAFYGQYQVSPNLLGAVDFEVAVTDLDGRMTTRSFSVAAAVEALLQQGIVFDSVVRFSGVQVAAGALRKGAVLYGLASDIAPGRAPEGGELTPVQDLGAYLPVEGALDAAVTVQGTLDPTRTEGVPARTLGLYRADGDRWVPLPTSRREGVLHAPTTRLGRFAVMSDQVAPRVGRADQADAVQVAEAGSGVAAVDFLDARGRPVEARFDPTTGLAHVDPDADLGVGLTRVAVRARDHAGNESVTRVAMHLSGPLRIRQALAVPNPVRGGRARLRYTLSRAGDRARVRIYDSVGRRIALIQGPAMAGDNDTFWDLRDRRGRRVANGVYLFEVDVQAGDQRQRARGKIAVLR